MICIIIQGLRQVIMHSSLGDQIYLLLCIYYANKLCHLFIYALFYLLKRRQATTAFSAVKQTCSF